jgi:hypothetical protein
MRPFVAAFVLVSGTRLWGQWALANAGALLAFRCCLQKQRADTMSGAVHRLVHGKLDRWSVAPNDERTACERRSARALGNGSRPRCSAVIRRAIHQRSSDPNPIKPSRGPVELRLSLQSRLRLLIGADGAKAGG